MQTSAIRMVGSSQRAARIVSNSCFKRPHPHPFSIRHAPQTAVTATAAIFSPSARRIAGKNLLCRVSCSQSAAAMHRAETAVKNCFTVHTS